MKMPKIQKVGTSAFIYKSGKVLLLRRSAKENPFPSYYELPGGKVEYGEKPEDGLLREILEETGLKVRVGLPYGTFSYFWGEIHFIDVQYYCYASDDKVIISPEHEEYLWANENDLTNLQITEQMREAIERGFKLIKLFFIMS